MTRCIVLTLALVSIVGAVGAVGAVAGCDGDPQSSREQECRAAVRHVIELDTRPPPGADDDTIDQLAAHRAILEANLDEDVLACRERPREWRHCVIAAWDLDAVDDCTGGRR
jgi:hypothetical protein